jgi:hypothetical protein
MDRYVSAEWMDDGMGGKVIKAIGDDDKEYWIASIDSDVPPWPQYLAVGGQIAGEPPPQTKPAE